MYKRIAIVVDNSEVTAAALSEGLRIAGDCRASVVFIYVISTYVVPLSDWDGSAHLSLQAFEARAQRESRRLLTRAGSAARRAGVPATAVVASGQDKATCICEAARKHHCDLIVIGSHGRTAMQRLIHGSVVTHLITLAQLPILVCKRRARKSKPAAGRKASGKLASARRKSQ